MSCRKPVWVWFQKRLGEKNKQIKKPVLGKWVSKWWRCGRKIAVSVRK